MRVKYIFRGAFRNGKLKLVQGCEYDLDQATIDLFPERFQIIEEQPKPKKAKKAEVQDGDTECE
jgi:hypothetical protein